MISLSEDTEEIWRKVGVETSNRLMNVQKITTTRGQWSTIREVLCSFALWSSSLSESTTSCGVRLNGLYGLELEEKNMTVRMTSTGVDHDEWQW